MIHTAIMIEYGDLKIDMGIRLQYSISKYTAIVDWKSKEAVSDEWYAMCKLWVWV